MTNVPRDFGQLDARERQALFDDINNLYYGGRVPQYQLKPMPAGYPTTMEGKCLRPKKIIYLQPGLAGDDLRRTVWHELAHHFTNYHGLKFQAILKETGAPWADIEIEMYKQGFTWNQEVQNLATSMGDFLDEGHTSLDDFVAWKARDFGMTPDELYQKIPWIKQRWNNLVAQLGGGGPGVCP